MNRRPIHLVGLLAVPFLLSTRSIADGPSSPYVLRIHAVRLLDDDGGRATSITPDQVRQWVEKANLLYTESQAGLQLKFNPDPSGPDWEERKDTILNNLSSNQQGWKEANAFTALHPGKIVIFFRHGGGERPTGNGFAFPPQSGLVTNFVALPGFNNTSVRTGKSADGKWIWKQNIWQLAHDVGHYLGLPHTFPGWSDGATGTPEKAAEYISKHGGTAEAMDGDGLADTPPDAGTAFYLNQNWDPCQEHATYTIDTFADGKTIHHTFTPDRRNVMSYFACDPMRFTPDQVKRMRDTLQLPVRQQLLQPEAKHDR